MLSFLPFVQQRRQLRLEIHGGGHRHGGRHGHRQDGRVCRRQGGCRLFFWGRHRCLEEQQDEGREKNGEVNVMPGLILFPPATIKQRELEAE